MTDTKIPPALIGVTTAHLKKVVRLSKLDRKQLREINREYGRLYTGNELTKYELIYQLTFLRDAPY